MFVNRDFTSIVTRMVFFGKSVIVSILLMKSVVSLICDLFLLTIFSRCMSTKCEILAVGEPIELTIGLPGLLVLCIFGKKYMLGLLLLFCKRFLPSCSGSDFSLVTVIDDYLILFCWIIR